MSNYQHSEQKRASFEGALICSYTIGRETFQILVNEDLGWRYKNGEKLDPGEVIETWAIYSDVKRGEIPTENIVKDAFPELNGDERKICKLILDKGSLQLTAAERARRLAEKENQIINFIRKNSYDPSTNLPIPEERIRNGMKDPLLAPKIKIDLYEHVDVQARKIVRILAEGMAIRMETMKILVRTPPDLSQKMYSIFSRFGSVKKTEYNNRGQMLCVVEFPAGNREQLYDAIGKGGGGRVELKPLDEKAVI